MRRKFQRIGWGILLFILGTMAKSSAETLTLPSKITEVVVYPGSALVTRTVEVDFLSGSHSIVIENIIPQLDENSLTVSGVGEAQVKLFGVELKKEFLKQSSDPRVEDLKQRMEALEDQTNHENAQGLVLDQEKEFLNSIKLFSGGQIPKDLVTTMPPVGNLEGVLDFLSSKLTAIDEKKEAMGLKVRDFKRQQDALKRELNQLQSATGEMMRTIVVDLECLKPGGFTLSISYLAYGVNWRPVYQARAALEKGEVDLSSFAYVQQSTAEDWVNAQLTISTAKPSLGGRMPQLSPWYLYPYVVRPLGRGVAGMAMKAPASLTVSVTNTEEFMEAEMMDAQQPPQTPAEVVYAQMESKGTAVVYKIAKAVNIPSDGMDHHAAITSLNFPVKFEYTATPKLSPYAYLMAEVMNDQEGQLLPGRVNIFLDSNYVGNSDIAKAIGAKEKFELYLGIDEGITVKRDLIEKKSDDTMIGNFPSPTKKESYVYKLKVENYKGKPVSLRLFDQIPVSQDDKIKVRDVKFSVPPTQKDYEDRKGVMKWDVKLDPQEKKEITFSYLIEYPRDLVVGGL